MIQTDTIIVNSTFVTVYVLTVYDGIKEEVDIKNNTIYLWYDEQEGFEIWLKIRSDSPKLISEYLSNRIGIKDVIDSSSVGIYKRLYDDYKKFTKYLNPDELGKIEFPENETLGQDFLSTLHEGREINKTTYNYKHSSLSTNNVAFNQPYSRKLLVVTKVTSVNDAVNHDFEPLAA